MLAGCTLILGFFGYVVLYLALIIFAARFCGMNGKYGDECQRCGSEDLYYYHDLIRCRHCGATHVVSKIADKFSAAA